MILFSDVFQSTTTIKKEGQRVAFDLGQKAALEWTSTKTAKHCEPVNVMSTLQTYLWGTGGIASPRQTLIL